jgi:alginate O-acetyltransferase complex protein AlgI
MLFNSIDFAIFLPIVFIIYWFLLKNSLKMQNFFIVVASYVFYGWWDWRFLSLIFFSTIVDYAIGLLMQKKEHSTQRKTLLIISMLVNLGLLGVFKYYNFFVENFIEVFQFFGHSFEANTLNIILPVGISFYTFQTMSYTIDIYKRKLSPTNDFISFAAFVSFFPQLVAGPIERATQLLPQFSQKRVFDEKEGVLGLKQILWGLFKKIVIADNCAVYVNTVFENPDMYHGSTLFLGGLFFAFQIYGDFSGYSDIAIGTARLFGFNLMKNFDFPYFSRDIAEFWRRWHISLSTWFRDYVYIPLGGSKGGTWMKIRNTFIIFIVSGFWHGANWTFIVWGLLNALYFLPLLLTNNNRNNLHIVAHDRFLPSYKEFFQMMLTFCFTVLAWIFFRADNVSQALIYLQKVFSMSLFYFPQVKFLYILGLVVLFVCIEWIGRKYAFAIAQLFHRKPAPIRWSFYYMLIMFIIYFAGQEQEFIYFQF